jgi:hypothetical protein
VTDLAFDRWCADQPGSQLIEIVQHCIENLRQPWEGNHVVLPHRSLGPVYAAEAERRSVAIYHFSADAKSAANAIGESRRRAQYVIDTARPPGPRCFFEWQNHERGYEHLAHGIYTEGDGKHYRFVRWGDDINDRLSRPTPWAWGYFSLYAWHGYIEFPQEWPQSPDRDRVTEALQYETCKEVALFWAFLASTGATVIERTPAPRGSSKDHKGRGAGAAILSFNRVRLRLPRGLIARNETVHWERGVGVRRHEVRAHPAYYWTGPRENRNLVVRWVAAYWRGNARLGLVLKARDVEAK